MRRELLQERQVKGTLRTSRPLYMPGAIVRQFWGLRGPRGVIS